ncbi:hypothetical protein PGT21_022050 [Puccinia graminis f. sp. tritici]|uniref:SET domain-containing protein n=1 Tax=Puccinia graminis f. sp. tritici TaxID=56615 RepID=A0A5B0QEM5_PUCGR|nr:hypothetical protein PGT21_022050 [Puccinia graminis f. sp. tritici]KAA1111434.1 hypothetical protein PGTUg99_006273 [Puccinia graminis f. sp. tritici]
MPTSLLSMAPKVQESQEAEACPFKSRSYVYDYTKVTELPIAPTDENPSRDGFTKQRCYPGSDPEAEEYCVYANPSFGGDRGMILYIRPSYLLQKLDLFTEFKPDSALITDKERTEFPFKLVHMPSKGGLGAVADRKINVGQLVIVDYSLVYLSADITEIDLSEWAPRLKYMVNLLPLKGRELFAKQHGVGEIDTAWIVSAFQRNVFAAPQDNDSQGGCAFAPEPAVSFLFFGGGGIKAQDDSKHLLTDMISRSCLMLYMQYLNHDCRPNVGYRFNNVTIQVEMHALREIAPGEELSISYITLVQSREKRRKSLHGTYGFHCGCSQCSLSDAESEASDQRVEKIRELWDVISDWDSSPPSTPAMADEILELFKAERMDVVMEEPYTMASLVYNSWGLTHQARQFSALAISYGVYTHDKTWLETSSHLPLIYDPESHWSYNIGKKMDAEVQTTQTDIAHYFHVEL